MDKACSNINTALTVSKDAADKFVADARSFSNQCHQAVKEKEDTHIERIKKKKRLQNSDDNSQDNEELERRVAKYASIIRNHSLRGWFPSPYNPNLLIALFPGLRIRTGFQLGAYQHLDRNGNGQAMFFMIPDNRTLPGSPPKKALDDLEWQSYLDGLGLSDDMPQWKRKLRMVSHFLLGIFLPSHRSLPKWADSEIENYIEGDGTPLSYFQASIFFRELYDLGAIWHNVSWGHQKFVTSPSDILYENWIHEEPTPIEWTWNEPEPKKWCPVVWRDKDQRWNVTFHAIDMMNATLTSYTDTFVEGYKFTISSKIIADYPGGYVV